MTMTASELVEQIKGDYRGQLTEAEVRSDGQVWVGVPREDIRQLMEHLKQAHAPLHLSTITGIDLGESIGILYHCAAEGVSLNVHTAVPKQEDRIDSVTPVLPAAVLYEREVRDLLGVEFDGHPDMRRLILPEQWPEHDHPLRRDAREREESEDEGA
jgi:membrane-bound hydrogenase subunit beta